MVLLAQRALTWLLGTHWGGDRLESWPDNSFLLMLVNEAVGFIQTGYSFRALFHLDTIMSPEMTVNPIAGMLSKWVSLVQNLQYIEVWTYCPEPVGESESVSTQPRDNIACLLWIKSSVSKASRGIDFTNHTLWSYKPEAIKTYTSVLCS